MSVELKVFNRLLYQCKYFDQALLVKNISKMTYYTSSYCMQHNYRILKKHINELIELDKKDVKESFSKGFGPGGQNVNKLENCVQLTHVPTKQHVKEHGSRLLDENKQVAYLRLRAKVDIHLKGENSILIKLQNEKIGQNKTAKQKRKERLERIQILKNNNEFKDVKY